jgi:hypothetical protein
MPSININTYSTIDEALDLLTAKTERPWNISDFFNAILLHSLPLVAVTPTTSKVIIKGYGVPLNIPADMGWRTALLNAYHVKQLWLTGETRTSAPALELGDDDYCSWETIKKSRVDRRANTTTKALSTKESSMTDGAPSLSQGYKARPIRDPKPPEYIERPIEYGEWVGESDIFFFMDQVAVNIDAVRVPKHTLAELLNVEHSEKQINIPSENAQNNSSAPIATTSTHNIKNRSIPLATEIALAKSTAHDPENVDSLMAELVKLADIKYGCLIGSAENSVKYRDGGEVRIFTKRNLRDRMRRAKEREGALRSAKAR